MRTAVNQNVAVLLDDGESVMDGIAKACAQAGTDSAMVLSGIGMMREVELGYWNGREYEMHSFDSPMELLSLGGSFAMLEGSPSVHLHAALADGSHRVIGGHLSRGVVHNINEIALAPFGSGMFARKYSEKTGLNMLRFTR